MITYPGGIVLSRLEDSCAPAGGLAEPSYEAWDTPAMKAFLPIFAAILLVSAGGSGCGPAKHHEGGNGSATAQGEPRAGTTQLAADQLKIALLPPPPGMRVVEGPQDGPFGRLRPPRRANKKVSPPGLEHCMEISGTTPRWPASLNERPAAEQALANPKDRNLVFQTVITLPPSFSRKSLQFFVPQGCARVRTTIEGLKTTVTIRRLDAAELPSVPGTEVFGIRQDMRSELSTTSITAVNVCSDRLALSMTFIGNQGLMGSTGGIIAQAWDRLVNTADRN